MGAIRFENVSRRQELCRKANNTFLVIILIHKPCISQATSTYVLLLCIKAAKQDEPV